MTLKARARAVARVGTTLADALVLVVILGSTAGGPRALAAAPLPVETAAAALPHSGHCPDDLADRLARTGRARQLLTVETPGFSSVVATVEIWQWDGGCWQGTGGPWTAFIGRNGFSDHHREGDGTTPTGIYAIGPEMYGNAPNPGTAYPYHRLVCGDWWDEDPSSPHYNTFQHVPCDQEPPFGRASEALWTETSAYPGLAVIEYNAHPVVAYAGSAIFVHAETGAPTSGCVALPLAELDRALRWLVPSLRPAVVMGPAAEITRF
jgi:L,D-peptidoglycan transpeptidase YkuD (ErfK/YbiS/YcfS/YnhG family)